MPGPPLSPQTQRRLDRVFDEALRPLAAQLLVDACGHNLPFCEKSDMFALERIRFAALKFSEGRLDKLREAVHIAQTDWRDVLVAAGFANDLTTHQDWLADESTSCD
ncbi:MAG: hypothetical protein GC162_03710 [Planctomycetes bacterium]|nr:hypothetical protein [Planctomycetota bacterium]